MKNLNDKQGQGTWNVYERTGFLDRVHKEAVLSTSPARCLTAVTICMVQQVQTLQRKEALLLHSPHLGLEYGNATLILLRQT